MAAAQLAANYAAEFSMQLLRGQMVDSLMTGQYANGISLNEFMLGAASNAAGGPAAPANRPSAPKDDALTRLVRGKT